MSDIYVVTRYWDNGEVYNKDFQQDEFPFMAFSTYENAMEYLEHRLSNSDILGNLAGFYDDVTPYEPAEGEDCCGVWYKCRYTYSGNTANVRFLIYKVKMGD